MDVCEPMGALTPQLELLALQRTGREETADFPKASSSAQDASNGFAVAEVYKPTGLLRPHFELPAFLDCQEASALPKTSSPPHSTANGCSSSSNPVEACKPMGVLRPQLQLPASLDCEEAVGFPKGSSSTQGTANRSACSSSSSIDVCEPMDVLMPQLDLLASQRLQILEQHERAIQAAEAVRTHPSTSSQGATIRSSVASTSGDGTAQYNQEVPDLDPAAEAIRKMDAELAAIIQKFDSEHQDTSETEEPAAENQVAGLPFGCQTSVRNSFRWQHSCLRTRSCQFRVQLNPWSTAKGIDDQIEEVATFEDELPASPRYVIHGPESLRSPRCQRGVGDFKVKSIKDLSAWLDDRSRLLAMTNESRKGDRKSRKSVDNQTGKDDVDIALELALENAIFNVSEVL